MSQGARAGALLAGHYLLVIPGVTLPVLRGEGGGGFAFESCCSCAPPRGLVAPWGTPLLGQCCGCSLGVKQLLCPSAGCLQPVPCFLLWHWAFPSPSRQQDCSSRVWKAPSQGVPQLGWGCLRLPPLGCMQTTQLLAMWWHLKVALCHPHLHTSDG